MQAAYFPRDGQPVLYDNGTAGAKIAYDRYGNTTEIPFLGPEGQLATVEQIGAAGRSFRYDEWGNVVEGTFFDPNRQLARGKLGFARQTVVWDAQGRTVQTVFGPDGKPVTIKQSGQA